MSGGYCALLPLFGTFLAAAGCAAPSQGAGGIETLCEIRARQQYFDQKAVAVRAEIDIDEHGAVVIDPHCPTRTAQLRFSELAVRAGYATSIRDAFRRKNLGELLTVTATLNGTFSLNKADGIAELIVDKVDDLDIRRAGAIER